jgi:hypothetical protein
MQELPRTLIDCRIQRCSDSWRHHRCARGVDAADHPLQKVNCTFAGVARVVGAEGRGQAVAAENVRCKRSSAELAGLARPLVPASDLDSSNRERAVTASPVLQIEHNTVRASALAILHVGIQTHHACMSDSMRSTMDFEVGSSCCSGMRFKVASAA